MNVQMDEKKVTAGQWVVCEWKDNKVIAQVKRVIQDTGNNKVELWGTWGCEGAIHGDWGYNYANECRYATVEEINTESVRRVFAQKGRKPNEYHAGDVVTDDVYAACVLHVIDDKATVQIMNSHQIYEVAIGNLEILFFAEDRAG